ncbi:hypothetical protein [Sulfuricurvum sp.]|uniref:hypothetical protein n=1 Tax=Sulfuricurvum sp. TaxID=2025608 RepID=UPI003BB4B379
MNNHHNYEAYYGIVQSSIKLSNNPKDIKMNHTLLLSAAVSTLLLVGCANRGSVSPSQNASLHTVSPNAPAASEGGAMQRALDAWLKEEWAPLTQPKQVTTTTTMPDGKVVTETKMMEVPNTDINETFTLQKYADKWKIYQENKEKMNAGKPKDPSHIDMLNRMPLIGK